MRGIDERGIRQGEERVAERGVQLLRKVVGRRTRRRHQIWAADIADEQRVTGQHRYRIPAVRREIEHQQGDRLRRVPGRLARGDPDVAKLDDIAVRQRYALVLRLRGAPEINGRARALAQLKVTGDKVGVEVREKHMLDPHAVLRREVEINLDVPLWIDDGGDAARLVANQVRRMREALEIKLLENHGR